MRRSTVATLILGLCAPFTASCGGGGGGGGGTPGIGQAILNVTGSTLQGVQYSTSTESGVTDATGAVPYAPGETITLQLGGTVLGSAPASASLSLLDLCPGANLPVTNARALDAVTYYHPEFAKLTNIAILLYFLDSDGNAANGIQIPSDVLTLLNGVDLNVAQPIERFRNSLALRTLRRDGLNMGLWGGVGRPIPLTGIALDQLYQDLNVQHRFCRSMASSTYNTSSGAINYNSALNYDSQGHTLSEVATNPGGSSAGRRDYTYSAWGRKTSDSLMDGGGSLSNSEQYDYNANGHETRYARDEDGDGTPDFVTLTTYDDLGNPQTAGPDDDNNGLIDSVSSTWSYDSEGVLLQRDILNDFFGQIQLTTYFYDAEGNLVIHERDNDQDGTPEYREVLTYDSLGKLLTRNVNTDALGADEWSIASTYDAAGRILTSNYDADADGSDEQVDVYTYDAADNLVRYTQDNAPLGSINRVEDYPHDADGNKTEDRVNSDGIGALESWTVYYFDTNGWIERERRDFDDSGSIEITENVKTYVGESGTWTHVLSDDSGTT